MSESGQLVGFNFSQQKIAHSVTVAMTGGGKGVDKVATIAETFPFGIDWYIAEIGQSYRWTVEAFGGTYTRLDPTESVINPLPPYSVATLASSDNKQALPLDAFIAGQTINALAFLLTDGRTSLTVHEAKAGQDALQYLYAVPSGRGGPFLQAEKILKTATSVTPDPRGKAGFYRYANEFMEMIYNPTTGEVWYMVPLR